MKSILIVLDSVGIGHAPDAADFGDVGSATLPHIGQAVGGLALPTLESLGLGCIPPLLPQPLTIPGVSPVAAPLITVVRIIVSGKKGSNVMSPLRPRSWKRFT